MQVSDRPKRWEKGVFHRGELRQYLKVMTKEESDVLFCMEKNKDVPTELLAIAFSTTLGEKLKKIYNSYIGRDT